MDNALNSPISSLKMELDCLIALNEGSKRYNNWYRYFEIQGTSYVSIGSKRYCGFEMQWRI